MFSYFFEPSAAAPAIGSTAAVALQTDPDYNNQLISINENLNSLNVLVFALLFVLTFKVLVSFFRSFLNLH